MFACPFRWSLVAALVISAGQAGPKPEPSRDHYGDPLPVGATARMGTIRWRHRGEVVSVVFSPDGRMLASAGPDGVVRICEPTKGTQLRELGIAGTPVLNLAFSPDSALLAGAAYDHSVCLWDAATGKLRTRLTGLRGVACTTAFAPDGRAVVAGGIDRVIRLWDTSTSKPIRALEGHADSVEAVVFSPDGKTIASAGRDETIRLWEAATGREIQVLEGHEGHVRAVCFSPDGKRLVSGGVDWTVRLWDSGTGKAIRSFKAAENAIVSVVFLPDGKTVAVAAEDWTVRLWDADTGKVIRALGKSRGVPSALAVSPDGRVLAAGGREGEVQLWETATGRPTGEQYPRHHGPVYALALSPDGRALLSGGHDLLLRSWDAASGRPAKPATALPADLVVAAFSTDGRRFAGTVRSQSGIRVGDCATGKLLPNWRDHPFKDDVTRDIAFSPDGTLLASANSGGARLWDTVGGKEVRYLNHPAQVVRVEFSPDGKQLATLCNDSAIRLWNTATGTPARRLGKQDNPIDLAFSSDGQWLATASKEKDQPIHLWSLQDELPPLAWKVSGGTVKRLGFTPDGRALCAGTMEGSMRFWETASGEEVGAFEGHWHMVQALAFASDNRMVYSGGFDANVLAWDLARLGQRSPRGKDMQKLWTALTDRAPAAWAAVWGLVEEPKPALAWLKERLKPVNVNANLARLVADLDSKQFAVRQRATQELERLGELARPVLRQALANQPSLEKRQRLERLLGKKPEKLSPEQLRDLRAVHALEQIGTPEAVRLLETVATGNAGARLTREAKASLERLTRRHAGR